MPEGERIDVEDIRDQRLRDNRELKAVKQGEAWLIRTPLIEAKFPPGTIVVVDVGAHAYASDFVLADVWHGQERSIAFRLYLFSAGLGMLCRQLTIGSRSHR